MGSVPRCARTPAPPAARGIGASSQVSAPAAASWMPPLRTADHPATPWWSALLRGGVGGGGGGEESSEWVGSGGGAGQWRDER